MAETTFADPADPAEPEGEHSLGKFRRGPVEFFVIFVSTPLGTPNTYRVDCDDGVGPREVCRFGDDTEKPAIWRGAWNGDPWCPWILEKARELVDRPSLFDY